MPLDLPTLPQLKRHLVSGGGHPAGQARPGMQIGCMRLHSAMDAAPRSSGRLGVRGAHLRDAVLEAGQRRVRREALLCDRGVTRQVVLPGSVSWSATAVRLWGHAYEHERNGWHAAALAYHVEQVAFVVGYARGHGALQGFHRQYFDADIDDVRHVETEMFHE